MNRAGLPLSWAPDDEQLRVRGGGHQRLDAGEPIPAGGAHGDGLQRRGVEQGVRFGDGNARLRDVLACELGEIGGLLIGAAPVGQRGGDTARREDRQRETHVAVREGLRDECIG